MFADRRKRFLDAMGPDAVAIIPGARLVRRSADTEFPFRQDSDFWYLTGFNHPDATAVFRTTPGRPAYTLFVQPRDRAAETWTGCLLYTSPSPRDRTRSRMPSSA